MTALTLAIIASFTAGAIFGAIGVVWFASRVTVAAIEQKPEPNYYGYLKARGRIEDPHAEPWGDQ